MNKELRRVSFVVLLMFLALFGSSTFIQVFQQDSLRADSRNTRTLYDSYSRERGPILVGGEAIAESTPVDDQYRFQRSYADRIYSPVTGYFTLNQGNTGIEGALNDYLSGSSNEQFLDQLNATITGQDPKGAAVSLSLDPEVQRAAWDALEGKKGAVVAIEPATGRILAMVSRPTFDADVFAVHDSGSVIQSYDQLLADADQPLQNRAIAGDLNPPGSVFKLVVTAAALESGRYTPEDAFDNPAQLTLPGTSSVITNSSGGTCGGGAEATIATALRLSCNIPFAELGRELGWQAISDQAKAFGFEQDLRIPLKVTPSVYPPTESEAQTMLSAFGQASDRVTPLQMAMVSAAVANDGRLMKPDLVDEITAPDLSVLEGFEPEVLSEPISPETAATMTQMMVQGVTNGAASNARIDGVDVAGKTGTAENGEGEPYTLWFSGFAPADDPQVAVAVVVEDGGGMGQDGFGNLLAAPVAKSVIEAVLSR
ncbi:peptidoglycan D,D-transpeptidase FtsI family protein [Homoserinibacter sp. YIM 151385]|uniref:peptidoglycan D,D-transpeptidase FtsI family protein n=1 Tax=Homoserinibacter sp. YIM 151385 TaxID=2985506 RepID=UPI0022F07765|nr:penicillin-binding protein 2 [Homoserinibacter sp. YIM 151385]WBU37221.1 penicillin-binding protein 2 [Homoserinibacter sp. YIM 151385]